MDRIACKYYDANLPHFDHELETGFAKLVTITLQFIEQIKEKNGDYVIPIVDFERGKVIGTVKASESRLVSAFLSELEAYKNEIESIEYADIDLPVLWYDGVYQREWKEIDCTWSCDHEEEIEFRVTGLVWVPQHSDVIRFIAGFGYETWYDFAYNHYCDNTIITEELPECEGDECYEEDNDPCRKEVYEAPGGSDPMKLILIAGKGWMRRNYYCYQCSSKYDGSALPVCDNWNCPKTFTVKPSDEAIKALMIFYASLEHVLGETSEGIFTFKYTEFDNRCVYIDQEGNLRYEGNEDNDYQDEDYDDNDEYDYEDDYYEDSDGDYDYDDYDNKYDYDDYSYDDDEDEPRIYGDC